MLPDSCLVSLTSHFTLITIRSPMLLFDPQFPLMYSTILSLVSPSDPDSDPDPRYVYKPLRVSL